MGMIYWSRIRNLSCKNFYGLPQWDGWDATHHGRHIIYETQFLIGIFHLLVDKSKDLRENLRLCSQTFDFAVKESAGKKSEKQKRALLLLQLSFRLLSITLANGKPSKQRSRG